MGEVRPPTVTTEPTTPLAVLVAIEKAHQKVIDLCSGKERWTMRVPAEPDRDPDLVIGTALTAARKFIEAEARDASGLREAAEKARDLIARFLWNGDTNDGGDDLLAEEAHDVLRAALAAAPPEPRWPSATRENALAGPNSRDTRRERLFDGTGVLPTCARGHPRTTTCAHGCG